MEKAKFYLREAFQEVQYAKMCYRSFLGARSRGNIIFISITSSSMPPTYTKYLILTPQVYGMRLFRIVWILVNRICGLSEN
jgi:hypothetical protein